MDRDGAPVSERLAKLSFGDGAELRTASEDSLLRIQREDGTDELLPLAQLLLPLPAPQYQ